MWDLILFKVVARMIDIRMDSGILRVFEDGDSYENSDSYKKTTMRVQEISNQVIVISAMSGSMTPELYEEGIAEFRKRGYKFILAYIPTKKYQPAGFEPLAGTDLHMMRL